MVVERLTPAEVAAAVQRSGWVLRDPRGAAEFMGLAAELARALERKNEVKNPNAIRIEVDSALPPGAWYLKPT